ncbi:MAG: hypothetical protein U5L11_06220 [Arhodomonas sp.]|nr:hypothetical protein [Arhodomonas sp.]
MERVRQRRYPGVLGINIGKNRDTPLERAEEDYRYCLEQVYPHADYVVVNISSPNTPRVCRDLHAAEHLDTLLATMKVEQQRMVDGQHRYVPLVVKISPDLDEAAVRISAERVLAHRHRWRDCDQYQPIAGRPP